jgi:hypothetical protein
MSLPRVWQKICLHEEDGDEDGDEEDGHTEEQVPAKDDASIEI